MTKARSYHGEGLLSYYGATLSSLIQISKDAYITSEKYTFFLSELILTTQLPY